MIVEIERYLTMTVYLQCYLHRSLGRSCWCHSCVSESWFTS